MTGKGGTSSRDAGAADLGFDEGWVAAGYEPDPFLVTTGESAEGSSTAVGLAGQGDAEHGPVQLDEEADYAIRWVAADPERQRCSFSVSLAAGAGEPVPAIRATVGGDLVPGIASAERVRRARCARQRLHLGRLRLRLDPRHHPRPRGHARALSVRLTLPSRHASCRDARLGSTHRCS